MRKCPVCGQWFKHAFTLRRHEKTHLPPDRETRFRCNQCSKTFTRAENLKRHQKRHDNEDEYYEHCPHCNKRSRKGYLVTHLGTCRMRWQASNHETNGRHQAHGTATPLKWQQPEMIPEYVRDERGSQTLNENFEIIQMPGMVSHFCTQFTSLLRAVRREDHEGLKKAMCQLPREPASILEIHAKYLAWRDNLSRKWGYRYCHNLFALAASMNQVDIMTVLLDAGIDKTELDSYGWSALHWAAKHNQVRSIEYLLDRGANIDVHYEPVHVRPRTALGVAAEYESLEVFVVLLKRGAAMNVQISNYDGESLLSPLSRSDSKIKFLEILLDAGVDLEQRNYVERRAMHEAAAYGNIKAIDLLVRYGAVVDPVDEYNETPVCHAADLGGRHAVEVLLAHGASVDGAPRSWGATPLICAVGGGSQSEIVATIDSLLKVGAEVNLCRPRRQDQPSTTALAEACSVWGYRKDEVIDFLLKSGADVNLGDPKPLERALEFCRASIVEMLLQAGANIADVSEKCMCELREYSVNAPDQYCYDEAPEKLDLLEKYSRKEQ